MQPSLKAVTALVFTGGVALTIATASAHAQTEFSFNFFNAYDIAYSGPYDPGLTSDASGTLLAIPNGDGSYTAISGSATVTGFDAGQYELVPNSNAPNVTVLGPVVYYDNQLFPNQPNMLNVNGLSFVNSTGFQYGIYSLGSALFENYAFYDVNGATNLSNADFTLTAVPEPGVYALFGSLGLTGGALLRRRRAR